MLVTIASGQITFSKELVLALGSPKRVNLYEDKTGNRIAVKAATRGEVRFVDGSRGKKGRKDAKVVHKEPRVLALFHSYVEPLKLGSYYCVDAQILEYEKAAIFDMGKAVLYETDENTLERLKNSRKKKEPVNAAQ